MAEWLRQAAGRQRSVLLDAWSGIVSACPAAGVPGGRGGNVLDSAVSDGLGAWLDALFGQETPPVVSAAAERLIRIRAVQDRPPGEALAFFGDLKILLRRALDGEIRARQAWEDLLYLEDRVDALTRTAFDRYMACREQISRIRIREWQDRTARILAWAEKKGIAIPADSTSGDPGGKC